MKSLHNNQIDTTPRQQCTDVAPRDRLTQQQQQQQQGAIQWLRNTFYVAESGSISKAEVYAAYLVYCDSNNEQTFSRAAFGRLVVWKGTLKHR